MVWVLKVFGVNFVVIDKLMGDKYIFLIIIMKKLKNN